MWENDAGRHRALEEGGKNMDGNAINRRQVLKGAGLFTGGALLGSGLTLASTQRALGDKILTSGRFERPWYDLGIIGEPIMDNQLL